MDLSRRSFLRGTVAVASAAVIMNPADFLAARQIPIICGDGVHDDTAGLQALLDGLPVDIRNDCARVMTGNGVRLSRGIFKITRTLVVRREYTTIDSNMCLVSGLAPECHGVVIRAADVKHFHIAGNVLDYGPRPFNQELEYGTGHYMSWPDPNNALISH